MIRKNIATSFGQNAKAYARGRDDYPSEIYKKFFKLLGTSNGKKILDVGAGTGKSSVQLLRGTVSISICDPDPRMLRQARALLRGKNVVSFDVCKAELLPYRAQKFDAVTIAMAFHWFMPLRASREIKRVLKDGGFVFVYWSHVKNVSARNMENRKLSIRPDARVLKRFDPVFVASTLRKAGYKEVRVISLPYTWKVSIEQRIKNLSTASHIISLTPMERKKILDTARDLWRSQLGNKKHFFIKRLFRIVVGYA